MTTDDPSPDIPTDEAVARAMRGLGSDIYDVMNMALISSNSLEELLDLQGTPADSDICHLALPRTLLDSQKWAASHVSRMARDLMDRFEAAWKGVEMA